MMISCMQEIKTAGRDQKVDSTFQCCRPSPREGVVYVGPKGEEMIFKINQVLFTKIKRIRALKKKTI